MAYPTTIPVRLFKQGEFAVINGKKYVPERTCRIMERRGDCVCSACGEVLLSGWADPFEAIPLECFKYCFNCGAKVVGE